MIIHCTLSNKRIFCLSDLHLNAHRLEILQEILLRARKQEIDAVLFLGDIAENSYTKQSIDILQKKCSFPIYYVLGNHDFYGQWIDIVQKQVHSDRYLSTRIEPVALSSQSCLIGHDGWADGREGNFFGSTVILRDSLEILDFKPLNRDELLVVMNERSDEAVEHVHSQLNAAWATGSQSVLIATHIPPFLEVCLWDRKEATDHWSPFFVAKRMGEMLREFFGSRPDMQGVVLAGHTHHAAYAEILPNLKVHVLKPVEEHFDSEWDELFEEIVYNF